MSTDQAIEHPTAIPILDGVDPRSRARRSFSERVAAHAAVTCRIAECEVAICEAAGTLVRTVERGGRILTCGNGGSASEAQHFAAELVGRFRRERRALPAIALTTDSSILTAIANDYGYRDVFARQIEALGRAGDTLIGFSTSGESENVLRAAMAARSVEMSVVGVVGNGRSSLGNLSDVIVQVPSADTPSIQEMHMLITHILCDIVESAFCDGEVRA